MKNLTTLNLRDDGLVGDIPASITDMTALQANASYLDYNNLNVDPHLLTDQDVI